MSFRFFGLSALLVALWGSSLLRADDFREWRDAKSGNSIEAKIVDKREGKNGLEVQLVLKRNRQASWINVKERLLPQEVEYVKAWVKPEERFKFVKFAYADPVHSNAAWFEVNTGNHAIRVSVKSTGKPGQEFVFEKDTKKTVYLPLAPFELNRSGSSRATVRVYNKESDLFLFVLRNLSNGG